MAAYLKRGDAMARTSGRRAGDQRGRRRDEEYGRDQDSGRNEEYGRGQEARRGQGEDRSQVTADRGGDREQDTDSLIADMAKGFVEAQAKIAAPAAAGNQEMLTLLEKISRQLENLQAEPAGRPSQQGQGRGSGPATGNGQSRQAGQQAGSDQQGQQAAGQGQQAGPQADLGAIFSQLLSAGKAGGGAQQKGGQEESGAGQEGGRNSQGLQGGQGEGGKSAAAQTAAQALAQAQYELANELEASLTKLKQVISESEKLADRISNLLGQEGGSRRT